MTRHISGGVSPNHRVWQWRKSRAGGRGLGRTTLRRQSWYVALSDTCTEHFMKIKLKWIILSNK